MIDLAQIAQTTDRKQAQLRLDRRVPPPAFTIASPRSGEGDAMVKAGGNRGVHGKQIESERAPLKRRLARAGAESALKPPCTRVT